MRAWITIHEDKVFLGNIASPGRLEFTEPAVNEALRVEALQQSLGGDIILILTAASRAISTANA